MEKIFSTIGIGDDMRVSLATLQFEGGQFLVADSVAEARGATPPFELGGLFRGF